MFQQHVKAKHDQPVVESVKFVTREYRDTLPLFYFMMAGPSITHTHTRLYSSSIPVRVQLIPYIVGFPFKAVN